MSDLAYETKTGIKILVNKEESGFMVKEANRVIWNTWDSFFEKTETIEKLQAENEKLSSELVVAKDKWNMCDKSGTEYFGELQKVKAENEKLIKCVEFYAKCFAGDRARICLDELKKDKK